MKVNKFIFPMDFVILDMEEDENVSLLLGCPFLATARALIDVHDSKHTLRLEEEEVTFDVSKSMKHPKKHDGSLHFTCPYGTFAYDTCLLGYVRLQPLFSDAWWLL